MIRILNLEPENFCQPARERLEALGHVLEAELDRGSLLRQIANFDVLWVRLAHQIDRNVIQAGRCLRAIVTATTGLDHIDVRAADECGIRVLSLRGETEFLAGIPATAEHTWGLLLALNRHLVAAHRSVCRGDWNRDAFRGHDLKGKTLGILGLGRLGRQVARFGHVFGMRVVAYDPYLVNWPAEVTRCDRLQEFLSKSEVLSLHVPLNSDTHGMVGAKELDLLPRGAILVNTARGEILDSSALLSALQSGHLRGAALDVIPDERDVGSKVRWELIEFANKSDQLLITPHLGGATYESMAATEIFMVEKLARFLRETPSRPGAACA